jgi:hypothetical protein
MSFFRRLSRGGAPTTLRQRVLGFFAVLLAMTPAFAAAQDFGQSGEGRIEGIWTAGCVDHRQRTLQFMKGELTDIVEIYIDEECRRKLGTLARISAYELRGDRPRYLGEGGQVRELDLIVKSFSWTPEHPRYVAAFNAISECGIQDWSLGSARSILGLRQECYFLEGHSVYPAQPMKVPEPGDRLLELIDVVRAEVEGLKALDARLGRTESLPQGLRISVDFGNETHIDTRANQISPVLFQRR